MTTTSGSGEGGLVRHTIYMGSVYSIEETPTENFRFSFVPHRSTNSKSAWVGVTHRNDSVEYIRVRLMSAGNSLAVEQSLNLIDNNVLLILAGYWIDSL